MSESGEPVKIADECADMCRMRKSMIEQTGDDWMQCAPGECSYQTILDFLYPTVEPVWVQAAIEFDKKPRYIKWAYRFVWWYQDKLNELRHGR